MLKLQYFGHLMQRADSLEKTLMLGKVEGRRRRGQQSTKWLDGINDSRDMSLSKLQEMVKDREARHVTVFGVAKRETQLSDWTTKYCYARTHTHTHTHTLPACDSTQRTHYPHKSTCTWSYGEAGWRRMGAGPGWGHSKWPSPGRTAVGIARERQGAQMMGEGPRGVLPGPCWAPGSCWAWLTGQTDLFSFFFLTETKGWNH